MNKCWHISSQNLWAKYTASRHCFDYSLFQSVQGKEVTYWIW